MIIERGIWESQDLPSVDSDSSLVEWGVEFVGECIRHCSSVVR
jgi:hypothetical protein